MEIVALLILVVVGVVAGVVVKARRRKALRGERAAFIQKYPFPAELRNKLQRDAGFTLEQSGLVLDGLRQYFLACLAAQRSSIARVVGMPSKAVDTAWHEFILMTREYGKFCEQAFGKYLHHTPAAQMQPGDRALANTLHQMKGPAFSPAGWAMLGTVPLLFALDRHLGMKDGQVFDDTAFGALEKQRDLLLASAGSSSSSTWSSSSDTSSSSDSESESGSSFWSWGSGDSSGSSDSGSSDSGGSSCGGGGGDS